jgi:DNA polymerase III gamma/tau subunit
MSQADAQASLKIDSTYPWSGMPGMSKDMDDCGVSVNLTHVPNSSTPLHIVLWKGVDESQLQVKSLLDRITTLESMVAGLLETQRASVWFPQCLRPTPAGLDVVSRRESAGNESDFGSLLSNIVRPSAREVPSETEAEVAAEAEVEDDAQLEAEDDAYEQVEAEIEAEDEAEAEDEVEVEAEVEADAEAEAEEEQAEEEQAAEAEAEADAQLEEEAEAEEEEVVEYKKVEWKGVTYYVDAENQAYQMDSDGDLIDTPIGVWREETKKLVRYKQ